MRGTRQVNQLTHLSDTNKANTRWIITLQPKQTGTVIIPRCKWAITAASPSA